MSAPVATDALRLPSRGQAVLKWAVQIWFVVAVLGQLVFAASVAISYGHTLARGDWAGWNKFMEHGYVDGDGTGNVVVAIHLAAAVLVILAGAVQLVPSVRSRAPRFHRWSGRLYLAVAVLIAFTALYMIWVRGSVGDLSQHLAGTLNALAILLCAVLALRAALLRDFRAHRRWALRLYVVTLGVWFFRVGLNLWIVVNQGPAGFDPVTFRGPALTLLSFGQLVVPLILLEAYLRAQSRPGPRRLVVGVALLVSTVVMAAGTAAAARSTWLPRMDMRANRVSDLVSRTLGSEGIDVAVARYRELRTAGFPGWHESEADLNALGYQLLRMRRYDHAIAVLSLNAETHPASANAHDSLGEAYAAAGKRDLAIAAYRRALALDPGMKTAVTALERL